MDKEEKQILEERKILRKKREGYYDYE